MGPRAGSAGRGGENIAAVLDIDLLEAATGASKTFTVASDQNCRECGGTGAKTGTQPAQCRRCRGQGFEVADSGFGIPTRVRCRGCNGRGAVITDPCPGCRGAGRVEMREPVTVSIPAGVDTGIRFTYPSGGHAGDPGGVRGDLELVIRVREHKTFERDGHNLICQCPISFARAALGGPVEIATLTGHKVVIEVPRGAANAQHRGARAESRNAGPSTIRAQGRPARATRRRDADETQPGARGTVPQAGRPGGYSAPGSKEGYFRQVEESR